MNANIFNQGVFNDEDHIRIVSALWNYQSRHHPVALAAGALDSAISAIVLVHDTITDELKAYWGTFAIGVPSEVSELEGARHVAQWGNKLPDEIRDACFPFIADMKEPS